MLVCPACRAVVHGLFTAHDLDANLRCVGCSCEHPRLTVGEREIAVVWPDSAAATALVTTCADMLDHVAAGDSPEPDTFAAHALDHLATYAPAHWGAWADVDASLDLPRPVPFPWLASWLGDVDMLPAGPILALGCGPGGDLPALAATGREVWTLDPDLAALAYVAQVAAGGAVALPVRSAAHRTVVRTLRVPADVQRALAEVQLVCGTALDPPFRADTFAAIVAINVVDSVPDPWLLLQQAEAMLVDGGVLLLAAPWNWTDSVTPPACRLDRALPPEAPYREGMEALLTGRVVPTFLDALTLERSADGIPWSLTVHPRYTARYRMHVLRLRKSGGMLLAGP
ncbi:MAG: methyltransferase domain-containing protein [Myxococcales bacterium]|nr:methyltransferase domain-containing protein [Myxococcales bacterium]